MPVASDVSTFLKKARTRFLTGLLLDQAVFAAMAGAIGVILLLLVGTQVLDWYWPVLLFGGSLLIGFLRARRRLLSSYSLAQLIDQRLGLHDGISTTVYFRNSGSPPPAGLETVERQVAAQLTTGDIVRAVPLRTPRSVYGLVALLLMAGGMLGLRYGIMRTLDLRAPIARFDLGVLHEPREVQAATRKSEIQERFEQQLKQLGLSLEDLESPESRGEKTVQQELQAIPSPEGGEAASESGQRTGEKSSPEAGEPGDGTEPGDPSTAGERAEKGDPEAASPGKQNATPQSAKAGSQNSQAPQENSGLMDKMRDALANLMNKLKSPSQNDSQQQSANKTGQEGAGRQQGNKNSGMQAEGRSQSEGEPSPDQAGDQAGDGENMAANQPKGGDKSSDRPGSQDAKSGMGKQDGDKQIRDAEQLAAMGKISEIFGKRASQISGEITVEVPSGKQQLKTAYSEKKALHADAGGEMNRDEVPLIYQPYVQRYFEEMRKMRSKVKN